MFEREHEAVAAFAILLRETLIVTAVLVLPILALATLVGAAVAIVQAATQIQEQTLTLLPKIVVVGAAVALFGAFGMNLCARLFMDVLARLPELVHGA
jgi:flagellar biosynthetic protein FliQ